MKTLSALVLLCAALVLCAAESEPMFSSNCDEADLGNVTELAVYTILMNHDHGYKFKLDKLQASSINQVTPGGSCEINLQIKLKETKCTVTNPKYVNDCDVWSMSERPVVANCSVMVDVHENIAKVTRYECDTRQEITNAEMMSRCPDCPSLIALDSPESLKAVHDAVKKFNEDTSHNNTYVLHEVGRVLSYYMMMAGMMYSPRFTLVETRCPRGSKILPEACIPLCPRRAKHAYCNARYSTVNGLQSLDCEHYPAEDTLALPAGETEPICKHSHTRYGPPGPPGPPPHNGPPGPPRGNLPNFDPPPSHPVHPHMSCQEAKPERDTRIHAICDWPVRQILVPGQPKV